MHYVGKSVTSPLSDTHGRGVIFARSPRIAQGLPPGRVWGRLRAVGQKYGKTFDEGYASVDYCVTCGQSKYKCQTHRCMLLAWVGPSTPQRTTTSITQSAATMRCQTYVGPDLSKLPIADGAGREASTAVLRTTEDGDGRV
jgi:hypothetical protein